MARTSTIPGSRHRLHPGGLVLLTAFLLAHTGLAHTGQPFSGAAHKDPPAVPRTVHLVIDYGDGCEKHFPRLKWQEDMTVLDVLQLGAEHPRGIKIDYQGRGATAFLLRLDNLENQGAGGHNWVFLVNDRLAGRGMGQVKVKPSDKVVWQYRGAGS